MRLQKEENLEMMNNFIFNELLPPSKKKNKKADMNVHILEKWLVHIVYHSLQLLREEFVKCGMCI